MDCFRPQKANRAYDFIGVAFKTKAMGEKRMVYMGRVEWLETKSCGVRDQGNWFLASRQGSTGQNSLQAKRRVVKWLQCSSWG